MGGSLIQRDPVLTLRGHENLLPLSSVRTFFFPLAAIRTVLPFPAQATTPLCPTPPPEGCLIRLETFKRGSLLRPQSGTFNFLKAL